MFKIILANFLTPLVNFRNFLFEKSFFKIIQLPVPIISVGNLTVGGTGKTPFTDFLLHRIKKHCDLPLVVSRSYGANAANPEAVDLRNPFAARQYGDEPVLLKMRNPKIPVCVGKSKFKVAQWAWRSFKSDVIIVDDGFQHRKLQRDLDILLLDATASLADYALFPQGLGREPFRGILRAQLIAITKATLVSKSQLEELEKLLPPHIPRVTLAYQIKKIQKWKSGLLQREDEFVEEFQIQNFPYSVWLLSALTKPRTFEDQVRSFLSVSGHSAFRDHHSYSRRDLEEALESSRLSAAQILTTEKDAVKLQPLLKGDESLWVVPLEIEILKGEESLENCLRMLFEK